MRPTWDAGLRCMGGDAWLNARNFEDELAIPLNYRILGLEGSSRS